MRIAVFVGLVLAWFNAGLGREEAVPVETVAPRQDPPHVSRQEQVLVLGAPSPRPVLPYRISGPIPTYVTPDAAASPVVQPLPPVVPVPPPIPPHVVSQEEALLVGAPAPRPVLPYRISAPVSTACAPENVPGPHGATARLEHLLEAAIHLEAAGESQEAREVRQLVARERQALQDRLGEGKPKVPPRQILFHFRVVELSRSKLDKLGFEGTVLQGNKAVSLMDASDLQVLDNDAALIGFLEAAGKDKLARVLAEPTLVTVSGRRVTYQSGGDVAVTPSQADGQVKSMQSGTRIDLLPTIIEPDRVRVEIGMKIAEPVGATSANADPRQPSPLRIMAFDTGAEMKSGQTLIFHGPSRETGKPGDDSSEKIETLVLITSEILDTSLTARTD